MCAAKMRNQVLEKVRARQGGVAGQPTQAGKLIGPAPGSEIRDPVSRGKLQMRRRSMLSNIDPVP